MRTLPALLLLAALTQLCPAQDDHGNTCATATQILPGVPAAVTIEPAGDIDYLSFPAHAGHHYVISAGNASLGWWPDLRLFTADCDSEVPPPAANPDLHDFSAQTDTPVFIRISRSVYSRLDTGLCRVIVTDTGPSADDHADSAAAATVLPIDGTPVSGQYDYWLDTDLFRASCSPGVTYRFTIGSPSDSFFSSTIDLLGPDARTVLHSDTPYIRQGETADVYLYVPPDADPTRFVRFSARWPQPLVRYTIALSEVYHHPQPDDHPPTCAGATPLPIGEWAYIAIESPGDVDTLALPVELDHRYRVEFDARSAGHSYDFTPRVLFRDPQCALLDESILFGDSNTLFRAPLTGTVHLQLSVPASEGPVSFRARAVDLGTFPDDRADALTGAEVVHADDSVISGSLSGPEDRDVLAVDLAERTVYSIALRAPQAPSTYLAAVVRAPGAPPRGSTYSYANSSPDPWHAAYIYVPPGAGGTHAIVISGSPPGTAWEFRIAPFATRPTTDDLPDTCAEASPVPLDTWIAITIDTPADHDAISFPVIAQHRYRIEPRFVSGILETEWGQRCLHHAGCGGCSYLLIRAGETGIEQIIFGAVPYSDAVATDIRIADLGAFPDDHADSPLGATHILPDAQVHTGVIDSPADDIDVFAIRFEQPGDYVIRCSNTGTDFYGLTSVLADHDGFTFLDGLQDFNPGMIDDYEERHLLVSPGQTGEYFLWVYPSGSPDPEPYEVQARRSCPADFTRDGVLDSRDFFAFLEAYFEPYTLAADFDHDDLITDRDFFAFLDAFLAGCP